MGNSLRDTLHWVDEWRDGVVGEGVDVQRGKGMLIREQQNGAKRRGNVQVTWIEHDSVN